MEAETPKYRRDIKVRAINADALEAEFYLRSVYDKKASLEKGHPCYQDVPYVKAHSQHDNKTRWDMPVTDKHKELWPEGWRDFEAGSTGESFGTPIETWAAIPPARAKELLGMGYEAIEQIAHCPDDSLARLGPDAQSLREQAQRYLQPPDKEQLQLRQENEALKQEMSQIRSEMRQMMNQKAGEDYPAPKRRGRPPKTEAA